MAGPKDVIRHQLKHGQNLFERFTADLLDREYFVPGVEGGNHAAWILGHLACSEDWGMSLVAGGPKEIPQSTHDLFRGGTKCLPDPSKYPSRIEIDDLFRTARAHSLEVLGGFDERKWENESPEGANKTIFPNLGAIWALMGTHQFWHLGQLADCRRLMNKPSVLGM